MLTQDYHRSSKTRRAAQLVQRLETLTQDYASFFGAPSLLLRGRKKQGIHQSLTVLIGLQQIQRVPRAFCLEDAGAGPSIICAEGEIT
ncbi:MAG: hypothetical protein WBX25_28580 [Rhodomicrobium sp.]